MSRFSDSRSKLKRFQARSEGDLISGFLRESSVWLYRKPAIRALARQVAPRREPEKWLFLVGCYNSGTTVLRRLLESHPDIASFPHEGVNLTDAFPDLEAGGWPRMMYANHDCWEMATDGGEGRAERARRDWAIWWPRRAKVYLEKSIDHSTRMPWLDQHFPNAHFIAITRNGYCVSEGILRRSRPQGQAAVRVGAIYPVRMVAEQWVEIDRVVTRSCSLVRRCHSLRYEDLMADPVGELTKMFSFLNLPIPTLEREGAEIAIGKKRHELIDQNGASLARISDEDIAIMSEIMGETLALHGYRVL